jgi:hypothetical protein
MLKLPVVTPKGDKSFPETEIFAEIRVRTKIKSETGWYSTILRNPSRGAIKR